MKVQPTQPTPAVGIRDDHIGFRAEDFGRSVECRGRSARHLVEDDPGRTAADEIGIGRDPTADDRGATELGIVEDDATGVDVVALELVMRDAAERRFGDIDQGRAVGR
jgi:hypothetical protein